MSSLTIRDIPEPLMEKLRAAAAETRRSVNAQAVRWFEQAARDWLSRKERAELLAEIRDSRRSAARHRKRGHNSVALIRRMRDERTKATSRTGR
jgi:plasmid stability protein